LTEPSLFMAGVADNLIAPRHETLRQTATECGPYDAVEDTTVVQDLRTHTDATVAHYLSQGQIVSFEAVQSHCTPTEVGNQLQKLGQNFGANLQIMETDNQGSFLTVMILDETHATFYALLVHEDGSIIVVADLVVVKKGEQG
jgi:hypothetical protein